MSDPQVRSELQEPRVRRETRVLPELQALTQTELSGPQELQVPTEHKALKG